MKTNYKLMTWLSMIPLKPTDSTKKRLFCFAFTFLNGISVVNNIISCTAVIVKYISIKLEIALFAVFEVAANVGMFNVMMVGFFYRQRIARIYTSLSDIYVARKLCNLLLLLIETSLLNGRLAKYEYHHPNVILLQI